MTRQRSNDNKKKEHETMSVVGTPVVKVTVHHTLTAVQPQQLGRCVVV